LVLSALIASTVFLRRVVTSYFGLSVVALRDFEDLAISRGVSVARQRLLTLAASAVFTGAIGAIYAFYLGAVSAELFGFGYLATILSMILLGGSSTIYGAIAGAFVLTFISEFLVSLGPWRFVIISTMIIVIIWRYPSGLLFGLRSAAAGLSKSKKTVIESE
jgi:branched-chain amino acid transport system permease protein